MDRSVVLKHEYVLAVANACQLLIISSQATQPLLQTVRRLGDALLVHRDCACADLIIAPRCVDIGS